jgi:hypothetical protein
MGFLDSIKRLLSSPQKSNIIEVYLKDDKCGKMLKVILRKSYEISRVYEEQSDVKYMVNKVVICDKCFNRIKFSLGFDKHYNIISRQIEGGSFLSEEEYNQ